MTNNKLSQFLFIVKTFKGVASDMLKEIIFIMVNNRMYELHMYVGMLKIINRISKDFMLNLS